LAESEVHSGDQRQGIAPTALSAWSFVVAAVDSEVITSEQMVGALGLPNYSDLRHF
jgi:hypothetical protein